MQIPNLTLAAKLGAGAIAALAIVGGGIAAGLHFTAGTSQASAAAPLVASPSPTPSAAPTASAASAATRAVRVAAVQAEAQVLGITVKQLNADVRQGTPVGQLASQKGLSQAQFQARFQQAVKPLLDQDVAAGTLTAAQEQRALSRFSTTVPNWSQVPRARKPQASPTPA